MSCVGEHEGEVSPGDNTKLHVITKDAGLADGASTHLTQQEHGSLHHLPASHGHLPPAVSHVGQHPGQLLAVVAGGDACAELSSPVLDLWLGEKWRKLLDDGTGSG